MRVIKSVVQDHHSDVLVGMLQRCLTLTYNAIHYAESKHIDNRRGMKGFYRSLKDVDIPSCWKVGVITKACAVVRSREKGLNRGKATRHPKPLKPAVTLMGGFFTTVTGKLFVSLGHDRYEMVQLSHYAREKLEGLKMRSLTVTLLSISVCYSKEVAPIHARTVYGIDRNEKNLTFGDRRKVTQVDVSKVVRVKQRTREVVGSFRRDDARVRGRISSKYWRKAAHRTGQVLHDATNLIVKTASEDKAALALEDLTTIGRMYRRGSGQGADYRFRMKSWPYRQASQMVGYKAAWEGVTIIQLTKAETMGSSSTHACGEKLSRPSVGDVGHRRMLWCEACKVWVDRDVNAAVVLSERGLARLASSLPRPVADDRPPAGEKGLAHEAMRGNQTTPVILRVDASKSRRR